MKKKVFLCVVVALFGCCFYQIESRELRKKLQTLHRDIGDSLIRLKKEHPKTQSVVYSVLDQLGKYYAFSKGLIVKKKEYKTLLEKELTNTEKLKQESGSLKKQVAKMKNVMQVVNDKLKQDYQQADVIKAEKDSLSQEKEQFLREKEQLIREKKRITAERDALLQERQTLIQQRSSVQEKEASHAPKQQQPNAAPQQPIEALAHNEPVATIVEEDPSIPALA